MLAVDRAAQTRHAIAVGLAQYGYELATVGSIEEAMSFLHRMTVEVVLVDETLEDASNGRLSAELSRYPAQTVSLIVLSHGSAGSRLRALQRGAFDCLPKPLDSDLLRVLVARAVERTTLARTMRELLEEVEATNAELRAAREQLESRVQHATESLRAKVDELDAARCQLEAARQERDEFIDLIAHELGGPLTAIEGYAEVLGHDGVPAELHHRASTVIRAEIRRFARLVQDLTSPAQTPDELSLQLEDYDLTELVHEAIEVACAIAGARSVRAKMPEGSLGVRCDRDRIGQIVFNLLSNAVKYSTGREIRVSLSRRPGAAELRVANDGPCIPTDRLEAIFEPRVRLVAKGSRQRSGRGLGLYVARRIAEAHGGTLRAEPRQSGAEFVLCLPRARSHVRGWPR